MDSRAVVVGRGRTALHTDDKPDLRNPVTFPHGDRQRAERSYLRFAGVGIEFVATIVALTLLGVWLDGRLGTSPLLTIVLLLFGFAGATWNLIRTVLDADRRPYKPYKQDRRP